MRNAFLAVVLFCCSGVYASTELNMALNDVHQDAGNISDELADIGRMDGVKMENVQNLLKEWREEANEIIYADDIDEELQDQYLPKFVDKIKTIVQKTQPGALYVYQDFRMIDDTRHVLLLKEDSVSKDVLPFLYLTMREGLDVIGPGLVGSVKRYTITVVGSIPVTFRGGYDKLKYLVDLIDEQKQPAPNDMRWSIPETQTRGLTEKGLYLALLAMF